MLPLKKDWWKYAVCLAYSVLLTIAIIKHEPWFDEAQAWLLARDLDPLTLLTKHMRYEGSPGLWHLLLMLPAKLNLPYIFLNILSGFLALVSVYLFVRCSPFPPLVKALYPFSFFAFYQYAVVARSYVLLPLMLFMIAIIYKHRINKPLLFVILLTLLANVSMHGTIIAMGLMLVHFFSIIKHWNNIKPGIRFRQFVGFGAFGIVVLLLYLQLKPAPDLISVAAFSRDLTYLIPRSLSIFSESISTNFSVPSEKTKWLYTILLYFSRIVMIVSLIWLYLKKRLSTFIIPITGLFLFFTVIYANVWHQGTLFYIWLFALWISFENKDFVITPRVRTTKCLMTVLLVLTLAIQSYWSLRTFVFDYKFNYAASRDAAEYIKKNRLEEKKIYISGFHTISILPYFSNNIFINHNNKEKPCFWFWSRKNKIYSESYLDIAPYDPDIIILGIKYSSQDISTKENTWLPEITGYRMTKLLNGNLYWKDIPYEKDSFAIYEKILPPFSQSLLQKILVH
ncbi:MAG: hypothetical protein N2645_12700 [Clostridia bacterium]|nr:hypothetical protein [Clostridia bacterium]